MATSVQIVGQQSKVLSDLDLLVLIRMMFDDVRADLDRFSSLQAVTVRWDGCCTQYAPGTVELELESIASNATKKAEFLKLLAGLVHKLDSLGPTLAAAEMNRRWGVRGVKFHDYETSRLILAAEEIRQLVEQ